MEYMRIVRLGLIIVFLLSLGLFGVTEAAQFVLQDRTEPEITSDRDVLEITCDYTEEQLMEGLSASDEEDGNLTPQIIAGSFSRFIEDGVSDITYVVFDSADHPASLTRRVHFTDYHPPRFTLSEPLVFSEQEGSYTEAMTRLGATDQLDGDLKDWITQTNTDVNYQKVGSYTMSVQVESSLGAVSELALPVHVVSAESRNVDIALTGGILYTSTGSEIDPMDYVREVTYSQGNQLDVSSVDASSDVDTSQPGVYEIHYEVSDSSGNNGETWLTVVVTEE